MSELMEVVLAGRQGARLTRCGLPGKRWVQACCCSVYRPRRGLASEWRASRCGQRLASGTYLPLPEHLALPKRI